MYWTDDTIVNEADGHFIFPYDSPEYTKDFASVEHAKSYEVGTYVTVALQITEVFANWTKDKHDPYLQVSGVDAEKNMFHGLRLWMHSHGDVLAERIYLIRGLKVAQQRVWDANLSCYVRSSAAKVLESSVRTAVEDVTEVADVSRWWRTE